MKNKTLKTIYTIFCGIVAVALVVGVLHSFGSKGNYNPWLDVIAMVVSLVVLVLMVFIRELLFYLDELSEKVKELEDKSKGI